MQQALFSGMDAAGDMAAQVRTEIATGGARGGSADAIGGSVATHQAAKDEIARNSSPIAAHAGSERAPDSNLRAT